MKPRCVFQPIGDWIVAAFTVLTLVYMLYMLWCRVLPMQVRELDGANGLRKVKIHLITLVVSIGVTSILGTGMRLAYVLDWFGCEWMETISYIAICLMNVMVVLTATTLYYLYAKDRYDKKGTH